MTSSPTNTTQPEEMQQSEADLWQVIKWAVANSPLAMLFLDGKITMEEGRRLEQCKQIGQWGNLPGEMLQEVTRV